MSKIGNYVVGAEEDGTLIFNEQENCYEEVDNKEDQNKGEDDVIKPYPSKI